jgi:hypothetical protein
LPEIRDSIEINLQDLSLSDNYKLKINSLLLLILLEQRNNRKIFFIVNNNDQLDILQENNNYMVKNARKK